MMNSTSCTSYTSALERRGTSQQMTNITYATKISFMHICLLHLSSNSKNICGKKLAPAQRRTCFVNPNFAICIRLISDRLKNLDPRHDYRT